MSDLRAITRVLSRDICYSINENTIEEIRIRVNRPVILKYPEGKEDILDHVVSQTEILNILQSLCNNSIYSYQNQIFLENNDIIHELQFAYLFLFVC